MKSVLIVCSQHGNETLGSDLAKYITANHKNLIDGVEFVVANPKALRKKVRYIEADMNRSYLQDDGSYEYAQAQKLLGKIDKNKYKLVLDMHTTTCDMPPTAIVSAAADGSPARKFIGASKIKHIAVMKDDMLKHSLIGNCDYALSIEINRDQARKDATLEMLSSAIRRCLHSDKALELKRNVYSVDGRIMKSDQSLAGEVLQNYKQTSTGIYPILVGENSYKNQTDYIGFFASGVKSERI